MNVLVIDTETANGLEQPLPYDIGYAVVNIETGKILTQKSFVVAEIFLDKELMSSAYYAEKVPQYWKEIKQKKRILKSIFNIRKEIFADMKKYSVKRVGAYNMGFDKRAARNDVRFISGSLLRWMFPYKTEFFCIWNMACSSILLTKEYIQFAIENGFVSACGNVQTSAEVVYRYLTNNPAFIESHTGLEDVKIEIEIMLAVFRSGLKYKDNINSGCWQRVQRTRKEVCAG